MLETAVGFLLILTGIKLTVTTKCVQFRTLSHWIKIPLRRKPGEGVSLFGSLCTALASTIGTGNIIGVVGAILIGGAGALFWMELAAILGMAIKYAENSLAIRYRCRDDQGNWMGGPMVYLPKICPKCGDLFAWIFAGACVVAGVFGMGSLVQSNAITSALGAVLPQTAGAKFWLATILTAVTSAVLLGGICRIAEFAEKTVPFMAAGYIILCIVVLVRFWYRLPQVVDDIFSSALEARAIFGGGSGAMLVGLRRGLFSNEAGLGTAPIAASSAENVTEAEQGSAGIFATFFDTNVLCTLTGLAFLVACVTGTAGDPAKAALDAFAAGLPFSENVSKWVLSIFLTLFAFTTILGWFYYAERCLYWLLPSEKTRMIYTGVYLAAVFAGCLLPPNVVWKTAEFTNALMAMPNLTALLFWRRKNPARRNRAGKWVISDKRR